MPTPPSSTAAPPLRRLKIAVVTQYYRPEVVHVPYTLAEELASRGHDVRVVTAYPNYPDGALFPGYRQRLRRTERIRGILVRRVPIVVSHSTNPVGRFASYASFALSTLTSRRFVAGADVVYVYAAQMTAALAPSIWKRVFGTPFVLHLQDLWPESVTGSSLAGGSLARRLIAAALTPWLSSIYRQAAATIAIAPTMAALLGRRGVDRSRLHTVLNWTDEDALGLESHTTGLAKGHVSGRRRDDDIVQFTYAGNLGDHQDLETIVRAALLLVDTPRARIRIVGSGVAEQRLRDLVLELGVTNVEFRGRVSFDEMPGVFRRSDFQIVSLTNTPIFSGTIPSKLQASLASGVPVVVSVPGDVRDIVDKNRLGFSSTPEDPESMAAAIRAACDLPAAEREGMSRRCADFYASSMSLESQVTRIESILVDVARPAPRGR